jgi:hypothetical protein
LVSYGVFEGKDKRGTRQRITKAGIPKRRSSTCRPLDRRVEVVFWVAHNSAVDWCSLSVGVFVPTFERLF